MMGIAEEQIKDFQDNLVQNHIIEIQKGKREMNKYTLAQIHSLINSVIMVSEKFIAKVETGRAKSRETYSDLQKLKTEAEVLKSKLIKKKGKMNEGIKDMVQFVKEKKRDGIIVVMTTEGLQEMELSEFIKQPIDEILYDLNRDELTVLTFIKDPKWINDYACGLVIAELKKHYDNVYGLQFTSISKSFAMLRFNKGDNVYYLDPANNEFYKCGEKDFAGNRKYYIKN